MTVLSVSRMPLGCARLRKGAAVGVAGSIMRGIRNVVVILIVLAVGYNGGGLLGLGLAVLVIAVPVVIVVVVRRRRERVTTVDKRDAEWGRHLQNLRR